MIIVCDGDDELDSGSGRKRGRNTDSNITKGHAKKVAHENNGREKPRPAKGRGRKTVSENEPASRSIR
jgi:hypothetical protein